MGTHLFKSDLEKAFAPLIGSEKAERIAYCAEQFQKLTSAIMPRIPSGTEAEEVMRHLRHAWLYCQFAVQANLITGDELEVPEPEAAPLDGTGGDLVRIYRRLADNQMDSRDDVIEFDGRSYFRTGLIGGHSVLAEIMTPGTAFNDFVILVTEHTGGQQWFHIEATAGRVVGQKVEPK